MLAFAFSLLACQPRTLSTVTVIDNNKTKTLQTDERVVSGLLNQAGIKLNPNDRVLLNGLPVAPDQAIHRSPSVHRAMRARVARRAHATIVVPVQAARCPLRGTIRSRADAIVGPHDRRPAHCRIPAAPWATGRAT